jgi:hypothetical protein
MEAELELEKLFEEGLRIDCGDYLAVEKWWYETYRALTAFPEEQYSFRDVFVTVFSTPEEQIERGLEILNELVDRLKAWDLLPPRSPKAPDPIPLCGLNCD